MVSGAPACKIESRASAQQADHPVSLSPPAKPGVRKKRARQGWNTFLRPVRRWRGARWARRKPAIVPATVQIAFVVATLLRVVSLANVLYQVVRKPTELLFFVGGALDIRTVPSHAIELAAVYLDRSVAAVLAYSPDMTASPREKQDLAAFIHLCGAGAARRFARHGFQMMAGERCGDHLVTTYLAKVNAMKRQFLPLAVNNQN
jgi:hypothetical protein